jgi:DNA-directed RNA polymerase subunit M/transcription elongation factor TFIIS
MRFCDVCDNKLYHKDGNVLFCRVCLQETEIEVKTFVSRRELLGNASSKRLVRKQIVNQYTKFDPTLPHVNMPCLQSKHKDDPCTNKDMIAIRYDQDALKYVYLCPKCDSVWDETATEL